MSYGMGQIQPAGDQDPIEIGDLAKSDPIMSTASVLASQVMLKMAAVPKAKRLGEMVTVLNAADPSLGQKALLKYRSLESKYSPRKKDQAAFDSIRLVIGDALVGKVLSMAPAATSGLGQTLAEARGDVSRGVNDANALFCSFGAGGTALVGGFIDSFRSSGSTPGLIGGGAAAGASIAGCGAGSTLLQNQNALEMARLAQSGAAQQLAAQAARDANTTRMLMVGGGLLVVLVGGFAILRK